MLKDEDIIAAGQEERFTRKKHVDYSARIQTVRSDTNPFYHSVICFMGTELDVLAVGNLLLIKEEQYEGLKENYEGCYELD